MKNDLLLVAKDGLIHVSNYVKEKQMNYILNKKYSPKNISKVEVSPKIISSTNIDLDEIERRNFGEVLVNFTKTLENNFSSLDLAYFYNNIRTLSIETLRKEIYNETVGEYSTYGNYILLYDDSLQTLYHELFHMASSLEKNNKYYLGFRQVNGEREVGWGINEGYTELLTRRYFFNDKNLTYIHNYSNEVKIVTYLEKIVGRKKMESLYLRADLVGLLKEIRMYLTNEETVDFISKTDRIRYLYYTLMSNKSYFELYLNYSRDIYLYLYKAYIRKLRKEYKKNWMSNEELKRRIDEFLEDIQLGANFEDHYYPFIYKDDFISTNLKKKNKYVKLLLKVIIKE